MSVALVLLLALGAVALNVGIYTHASDQVLRQGWSSLAAQAERMRHDLRQRLYLFEQEARHVAGDPALLRALAGHDPAADAGAALRLAARSFRWSAIDVVTPVGAPVATSRAAGDPALVAPDLVREALSSGSRAVRVRIDPSRTRSWIDLAVPIQPPGGGSAPGVVICSAETEDLLRNQLVGWPGFGPAAGSYLIGRAGQDVVVFSRPPAGSRFAMGQAIPRSSPAFGAASAAVSEADWTPARASAQIGDLWLTTLHLPELHCGLVGQADGSAMALGLQSIRYALFGLDLALVLIAAAAAFLLRRQYEIGIARREIELTRAHADRMRAVVDSAFDAILTFDDEGRIRTANRAAEALFQRSAAELRDKPLGGLMVAEGRSLGQASLAPGTVARAEALPADGAAVPVEISFASAGDGDERAFSAIVRDVRERVRTEERIRTFTEGLERSNRRLAEMNAQLEAASRLKTEFLANTSHELRTPLNGILGFLQLVLDDMCSSRDEEREFLRQALQCSRHLLGLINDVLDIAKIEAGKLNLEIEPIPVATVFRDVYTVTHVQATQRGLKLEFIPPVRPEHPVRCDLGKLRQILINLVGNSLKFTERGSITVRATNQVELGHCLFEVTDTGAGIPKERQKHIFEKFIQGDGSTTRKYGGTGLGLAITRSLVEVMGGVIGVESEGEGQGTRVWFSIPLWHGEAEQNGAAGQRPADRIQGPAGGPIVLLVEDDPTFRLFLSAMLQQHGYRTVEATYAEAGWVLARRLRPAMVILDHALACPEGVTLRTGWDLAERMATDPITRGIPIIFVSGFEHEVLERVRSAQLARRPEHLPKPLDGPALIAKMEEVLGEGNDRPVRILMADDDPSVGAFVRKVLAEERFHIEFASTGEQCLHALRVQPQGFDLLLLDLMMPDVSGYDVLRQLTMSGQHANLPVLVLTNFADARDDEERELLRCGQVLDVLHKSAVHDNPVLLPHLIDWHLQVSDEMRRARGDEPEPGLEVEAA